MLNSDAEPWATKRPRLEDWTEHRIQGRGDGSTPRSTRNSSDAAVNRLHELSTRAAIADLRAPSSSSIGVNSDQTQMYPCFPRSSAAASHEERAHSGETQVSPTLEELGLSLEYLQTYYAADPGLIVTLAQVCCGRTVSQTGTEVLRRILNFRGWSRDVKQSQSISATGALTRLFKNKLQSLAAIFGLSTSGNKSNLNERIVSFLASPKPIVPSAFREKHLAAMQPASQPQSTVTLNQTAVPQQRVPWTTDFEGNSPGQILPGAVTTRPRSFERPTVVNRRPETRQTTVWPYTGPTAQNSTSSGAVTRNASAEVNRRRFYCSGLDREYDRKIAEFDPRTPESPFYIPISDPLGAQKYVVFKSSQLDHGEADQTLWFPTPPPPPPQEGYETQVHLRCILMDIDEEPANWRQMWPFPAIAKVNGTLVLLNQARRYTNGKLVGVDMATPIQTHLKRYRDVAQYHARNCPSNQVLLRRQKSSGSSTKGTFLLFAQQILVKSTDLVINEIKEQTEVYMKSRREWLHDSDRHLTDYELERQDLIRFMTEGGVTIESIKMSTRCPLAFTRIEIPAKGNNCAHIQCFDLRSYLDYSRRSLKFECPVCNQANAQPSSLVISSFFKEALRTFPGLADIEVTADGEMRKPLEKKVATRTSDKPSDRAGDGTLASPDGIPQPKMEPVPASASDSIIDLTLDDDDDGEEEGGRQQLELPAGSTDRTPLLTTYDSANFDFNLDNLPETQDLLPPVQSTNMGRTIVLS
eukprot:CAMPEP_0198734268 /NCGR_PEP_ID=MMETSP1475-20131203/51479_1 /TAXON_ID= ORGANISM="Unidentified sp., Strain CCMP1999" /NCGR_SAMPLE_ID=MMETSP1475 /ASSEMBLY_ACC=CAM_ASM_001111 /LENGTH=752 /DNA_ID=CAMNT_0044497703 /DNA_START=509 /DNA_END=2763 /DNA_ORIENTATION=-